MAKDSDPAWLRAMKKEADKLGIPLRELLTKSMKSKTKPKATKKTMTAAKGGMAKKKMMYGGMPKKKK
tara:strand:+ start:200 stop:403 length:204 start_codon:yes stop_codon:yes gene_type:complete